MNQRDVTFAGFLGKEQENLGVSQQNLGSHVEHFDRLDRFFASPLHRMAELKRDHWIHMWQYLFVRYHLYFSFACLLRCHISEALASARAAIDATLTSYYILNEANAAQRYVDWASGNSDGREFRHITETVRKMRGKEPPEFRIAERLIAFHNKFSGLGAHADPKTIHAFRTQFEVDHDVGTGQFRFDYFQAPTDASEFVVNYVLLLVTFFLMLRVFRMFLDQNIRTVDPEWESEYDQFFPHMRGLAKLAGIPVGS